MKEKRKQISIRWQLILVVVLVQIPFSCFFFYCSSRTVEQVDHQLAQSQQNALNVYRDALEKQITNAGTFLFTRCWGSETLHTVGETSNADSAGQALSELLTEAKRLLDTNAELDAITFYAARSDGNWTAVSGDTVQNHAYVQMLRELIEENNAINEGWIIRNFDGTNLLVRTCEYCGVYVMATMNLNAVASGDNIYGHIPTTIVVRKGSQILSGTVRFRGLDSSSISIQKRGSWYFAKDPNSGFRYQVVEVPFAGMSLCMGTRYQYDWTWVQLLGVCLAGVFALTLILGILYLNRTVFRPLNNLVNVMEAIGRGEHPQLELPNQNREFLRISAIFQDMLVTLDNQKIAVYENKLKAQRMETNALRLQIRRHFFLNCLKNIYAIANTGDMESVKKTVLLLSVNLRYTLDYHQNAVELERELQMCENYVDLQSVGQNRPPVLHRQVAPELVHFPIPSVSILTMLENCCKYGCRMDAPLEITVTANSRVMDEQKYVCIAIQDNGPGFRQEDLYDLNNNLAKVQEDGHVGIANTMARIRMMYGENCEVLFSNRPGARVEWIIPVTDREEQKV